MIAMAKEPIAMDRLRRFAATAWRPCQAKTPDVWAEENVWLTEEFEASRGRFDLTDRPWWRDVLNAIANPITQGVTIRASTQVGKTLSLIVVLLYLACNRPARAMVILPDQDAAIEFRDRVYALAKRLAALKDRIPPQYKWNTRYLQLGGMRVYLAWAGARQRLRGKACMYVLMSEVDVYQGRPGIGDPVEQGEQRVKAFSRYCVIRESSPIPEDSRIEKLEAASDRRRWWAQCPHCGAWQLVRFFFARDAGGFGGLKDDQGNFVEPDTARKSGHYLCRKGCVITNEQKSKFLRSGRWLAAGQSMDDHGQLQGVPDRNSREMGVHLWSIHSHYSFGEIAAKFLLARRNGTVADFWQNWLGMSWKQKGKMPTWQELGTRLAGPNRRGTVPDGAWFLTAGADVQDREVYVSVRAWGDQKTSWLVDWFVFERTDGDDGELVKSDLKRIGKEVLDRAYEVVDHAGVPARNPRGRDFLKVVRMGIDANHRTLDVHNWIRSLGESPRVIAVRGESNIKAEDRYKETVVHESRREGTDGKKVQYEGGLSILNLNPDVFRSDLADRFTADPTKPGAWFVTSDCLSVGEFFLKQVVNEPKVVVRGKDGRPRVEYRERDPTIGHDFWDCAVYEAAIAQRIVDGFEGQPGWDASKWPRPEQRKKAVDRELIESHVSRDFS